VPVYSVGCIFHAQTRGFGLPAPMFITPEECPSMSGVLTCCSGALKECVHVILCGSELFLIGIILHRTAANRLVEAGHLELLQVLSLIQNSVPTCATRQMLMTDNASSRAIIPPGGSGFSTPVYPGSMITSFANLWSAALQYDVRRSRHKTKVII